MGTCRPFRQRGEVLEISTNKDLHKQGEFHSREAQTIKESDPEIIVVPEPEIAPENDAGEAVHPAELQEEAGSTVEEGENCTFLLLVFTCSFATESTKRSWLLRTPRKIRKRRNKRKGLLRFESVRYAVDKKRKMMGIYYFRFVRFTIFLFSNFVFPNIFYLEEKTQKELPNEEEIVADPEEKLSPLQTLAMNMNGMKL